MKNSISDYEGYMQNYLEGLKKIIPEKGANTIYQYVRNKYDKLNRVYLDKQLMLRLVQNHIKLQGDTALFYGIVGLGGQGKTTLACNIAHFHDSTFNSKRLTWNYNEMGQAIEELNYEKYKAIIVDEPNDKPHPSSKAGIALAEVLGQIRFLNPIIIFCSTDLQDIHPSAFRKFNALFYVNAKGMCTLIRDNPEKEQYPLSDIKRTYQSQGYKAFKKVIESNNYPHLKFNTYKSNVLTDIEKGVTAEYLKKKKEVFKKSLGKLTGKIDKNGKEVVINRVKPVTKAQRMIELFEQGMTRGAIAIKLVTSYVYVSRIIRQHLDSKQQNPNQPKVNL